MSPIRPMDRLMNVLLNTSNNKEQFDHNEIFYSRTNLERLIFLIKISMTLEDFSQTFPGLEFTVISVFLMTKMHFWNRQHCKKNCIHFYKYCLF